MKSENTCESVNLLDYARRIWRNRILLFIIVGVSVAATILYSLSLDNIYEARAVLMPASGLNRDQTASALVAMQFGLAPPTSPAASEITNLLRSNILSERIVRKYNLTETFFGTKVQAGQAAESPPWDSIRLLQKIMKVSFTPKDNLIQVSVQYRDPRKAADIIGYALTELNEHMSGEAKRVADTNKMYLESQIEKAADPFIRAKIYGLIAQQVETSMMAEAKENFAFKLLDPPRVPDKKVKPKRVQMVIIAFLLSFVLAVCVVLGKEYIGTLRKNQV